MRESPATNPVQPALHSTHSEGFSLATACDEAEALCLYGHSSALDMLLHVPDWRVKIRCFKYVIFLFQDSASTVQANLIKGV